MVEFIPAAVRLATAIVALYGPAGTATDIHREVSPADAVRAACVVAIVADEFPPELIASIAIRESSMRPRPVNARSGACGPMQVLYAPPAFHGRMCRRILRDEVAGYVAGVAKLRMHVAEAGSVERGLAGYFGSASSRRAIAAARRTIRRAEALAGIGGADVDS